MKKNRKRLSHICKNCWWFINKGTEGRCLNCDCPGDIRNKKPNDVCDGGGRGADDYGFRPNEE